MRLTELFEENNGRLSSARIGALLLVLGFMGDWITHIVRMMEYDPSWSVVMLVSSVFGIKVVQKKFEAK